MLELTMIGHIGRDAEIKESNGNKFLSFSVAETLRKQVDEETGEVLRNEKTTWVRVTSNQLSLAPYLKKGTMIYLRGRFNVSNWKDDGGTWQVDVKASNPFIQLLSAKEKGQSESETEFQPEPENLEPESQHSDKRNKRKLVEA